MIKSAKKISIKKVHLTVIHDIYLNFDALNVYLLIELVSVKQAEFTEDYVKHNIMKEFQSYSKKLIC